ncbi:hypothetical protein BG015_006251 [Linnemannia schmuckeri]|uniref:Uncharacterized protein n=1 Tax=Linnemannia schmuckeri TaxID=64567 RepID=A0A9P5S3H9_9FUNG|nr:hypothetical protein BG015_006251 [Linnemannia schmuckeri]
MRIINALAVTLFVFATTSLAAPASIYSNNGLTAPLTRSIVNSLADTSALPLGNTLAGGGINGLTARSIAQDNENPITSMFPKRNLYADTILDVIIEINTEVTVKALAKLKLDLCSDIHAKVKIVASRMLTTNLDLVIPKISAKINTQTNTAINAKVEVDAQSLVKDKIQHHGLHAIHKHCPHADDRCLRKHALKIVECVE